MFKINNEKKAEYLLMNVFVLINLFVNIFVTQALKYNTKKQCLQAKEAARE